MKAEIKIFIIATLALLIGLLTGYSVSKKSFKYEVGQCFSNGLYIEKLVDIDHGEYVMLGMIKGHWIIPSKEKEHIMDSMMTKIKCPAKMQTDPYKKPN